MAALWLTDRSPQLSHIPLLSVLSLVCLVVPFASWLRVVVPCVLALAGGWLRGCLCLPAAAGLGCCLYLAVPCMPRALQPICCWYVCTPCPGLGCCPCVLCIWSWAGLCSPQSLSPLPCGLVALPHTVSLVWVWWPGLRGSGVRGVPRLVGRGVLAPGMSKPPSA